MHELSLCQNMLEIVELQCKSHDIKKSYGSLARNWRALLCRT